MAHELTLRADGRAEMAFVGETPWHGLGQNVTKGASIRVWQKEAGMDWEAKEGAVLFYPTEAQGSGKYDDPSLIDGYKVIYRGDSGKPLAIMGEGYQIVQPREVLEFFRDMTEVGGWHIHTAGTLRGGRKLWAMASNGEASLVGKGDQVRNNLLLATSLDGSMKTTAMLTSVRVVCANTLALALTGAGAENDRSVKVSHRSVFDPSAIKRALGVATDSFDTFMHQAKEMADIPVALDEARDVLMRIFKQPVKVADASWLGSLAELKAQAVEVKDSRSVSRILELFDGDARGASLKTAKGTRWGLFNAVTEYVDHEMGRTDDTRLDSAWFGRGNVFKQEAFELLVP